MRLKRTSFFVGIILVISLAIPAFVAGALNVKPQQVNFVNSQGIRLTGWVFKPDGNGPFPSVVMMPGCMGAYASGTGAKEISPMYLEWGDRLVTAGYVALLVDSQDQCGNTTAGRSEINIRHYDAYAGLNYLVTQSFVAADKVGLIGWSHGGSSVMAAMDESQSVDEAQFKAAVAFYPGCTLGNAFGDLKQSIWKPYAPFVILQGSVDAITDPATCTARVTGAQELGVTSVTINTFEDAQHRFDGATKAEDGFTQLDVDAKIAADAQVLHFFDTHLP